MAREPAARPPERQYAPNRLAEIRMARGKTLPQVAEAIGAAAQTIHKLEQRKMGLTVDYILKIAGFLGCSPGELIDEQGGRPIERKAPLLGRIPAVPWKETAADGHVTIPAHIWTPNVFALRADDDGMDLVAPRAPGAYVVVDTAQNTLRDGGVFVVRNRERGAMFRRFVVSVDGDAMLMPVSSSPAHKPIPLGTEPFTVLGRVVFAGVEL
jgi:repressor LexA